MGHGRSGSNAGFARVGRENDRKTSRWHTTKDKTVEGGRGFNGHGLPFGFGTGVGRSFLKDRIQRHAFGRRDRPSVFWVIQEDGVRFEHVCLFLGNLCQQGLDVIHHDVDVSGLFHTLNLCMDDGGGEGPEGDQPAGQHYDPHRF